LTRPSSSSSVLAAATKSWFLICVLTATKRVCTAVLFGPASAALISAVIALSRFTTAAPSGDELVGGAGEGGAVGAGSGTMSGAKSSRNLLACTKSWLLIDPLTATNNACTRALFGP